MNATFIKNKTKLITAGCVLFIVLSLGLFMVLSRSYSGLVSVSGEMQSDVSKKLSLLEKVNQNSCNGFILWQQMLEATGQNKLQLANTLERLSKSNDSSLTLIQPLLYSQQEKVLFKGVEDAKMAYIAERDSVLGRAATSQDVNNIMPLFNGLKAAERSLVDFEYNEATDTVNRVSDTISKLGNVIMILVIAMSAIFSVLIWMARNFYWKSVTNYKDLLLANEEKKRAYNQVKSILDTLPASIVMLDEKGIVVDVNQSWKKFIDENDFKRVNYGIGSSYIHTCGEENNIADGLKRILEGKTRIFSTIYPCHSPSKKKWFRLLAAREENGTGVVLMHLDITDRQETEERIKQSKANLRQIIDLVPMLIVVKNEKGEFILTNKRVAEMYGLKHTDDLLKKNILNIIPERSEGEKFYAQDLAVITSGNVSHCPNSEFTDHKGIKHYFDITRVPYVQAGTKEKAVLAVCFETTQARQAAEEIKKAEIALKQSEMELRALFAAMTDPVMVVDENGKYLSIAPTNSSNIYKPSQDLVGKTIHEQLPKKDADEIQKHIQTALRESRTVEFEYYMTINDKAVWFEASMSPLTDRSVFWVTRNITERKLIELEGLKVTTELVRRNRNLEQFAYIVSHNLRAPVANILGITTALQLMKLTPDKERQMKNDLIVLVKKLDEIIKDINNILAVTHGMQEGKQQVKLSEVVEDVKLSISDLIKKENAIIKYDFADADELYSLKSYLHSIFFNLITNSIKYRRPDAVPQIHISAQVKNDKIQIIFKDNSMGIDLGKYGKYVFGLYKRFNTQKDGKGMGLYMTKTQIEALGGNISLESAINQGSTFKIEFENKASGYSLN